MSNTERIKWELEAEDRATKKVRQVTENIERQTRQVKDLGGRAKASTELVGTLASTMGNTDFGGYAGEIAQITERISAFTEVANAGGFAAKAFNVGLVGAVGVLSFKVGSAIGDLVFQTEKWNQQLEESKDRLEQLLNLAEGIRDVRFNQTAEGATESQLQKQLDRINAEISGRSQKLLDLQTAKNQEAAAQSAAELAVVRIKNRLLLDNAETIKRENQSALSNLREQRAEIQEIINLRKRERENRAAEFKNQLFDEAEKKRAEIGIRNANEMMSIFKRAEDAEQKRIDRQIADEQRLEDIRKNALSNLRLRITALRDGTEAAEAMRLQMTGLDEETAKKIAKINKLINQPRSNPTPRLAGTDSRFGTGRADQQRNLLIKKTVDTAKASDQKLAQAVELLEEIADKDTSIKLDVFRI